MAADAPLPEIGRDNERMYLFPVKAKLLFRHQTRSGLAPGPAGSN